MNWNRFNIIIGMYNYTCLYNMWLYMPAYMDIINSLLPIGWNWKDLSELNQVNTSGTSSLNTDTASSVSVW